MAEVPPDTPPLVHALRGLEVLDALDVPVLLIRERPGPRVICGNAAAAGLFLRSQGTLTDLPLEDLLDGPLEAWPPTFDAPGEWVVTCQRSDRTPFLARWALTRGPGDVLVARIADVTEENLEKLQSLESQAKIRQAASDWRVTFDTMEYLVVIVAGTGRVLRLNAPALRRLNGNSFRDVIGGDIRQFAHRAPLRRAVDLLADVTERRDRASDTFWDEQIRWELNLRFVPGELLSEDRVIIMARDITAFTRMQERLRQSEVMSTLGSIVAGVAHEVRNPLFGISSLLDAFEARFQDMRGAERYLKLLRQNIDRLSNLMHDLLAYGSPKAMEFRPLAVVDLLQQTRDACLPLAQEKGVAIVIKGEASVRIEGDRDRLAQVATNLIENAVQHSPDGSEVTVTVTPGEAGDIHWEVRDRGRGFANEDLARLTEPFFTRRSNGTGLGLSIVQKILVDHHGSITFDNHPEGGGRVTVTLPETQANVSSA